jgi:hypothetical protein
MGWQEKRGNGVMYCTARKIGDILREAGWEEREQEEDGNSPHCTRSQ